MRSVNISSVSAENYLDDINSNLDLARERLTNLVKFLREFHRLRNPVVRDVGRYSGGFSFWFDELPEHDAIERGWQEDDADYLLRITRPNITSCPPPPDQLGEWLRSGWDDPSTEVEFIDVIETPSLIDEEDDEIRRFEEEVVDFRNELDQWNAQRQQWAEAEIPVRVTDKAYQDLYRLHGRLEAERERLDLQIGDGLLRWNTDGEVTNHPLVLQAAELEFEPALARITITLSTERQPELHSALLRLFSSINGSILSSVSTEFASGEIAVFGDEETDEFCRSTSARIHARGQFHADSGFFPPAGEPSISRRQVLFVRPRTFGYAVALDAIESSLDDLEEIPVSLMSLMGIEDIRDDVDTLPEGYLAHHDPDLLFTKAANTEQARIVKRLERDNAVMVQGPPGTGKTHTVANLIGHLLAQGKKILVTSHTAKALERVREEIVEELKPLAVSAVSSDAVSRSQLEDSVSRITDRLSNSSSDTLRTAAAGTRKEREQILSKIDVVRKNLRNALQSEYSELTILGSTLAPSAAAREIADGVGNHDWIPGEIKSRSELPLTREELARLYRTNHSLTSSEERQLISNLPDPDDLPVPTKFNQFVDELNTLRSTPSEVENGDWTESVGLDRKSDLEHLIGVLANASTAISDIDDWTMPILDAAIRGSGFAEVWRSLTKSIEHVHTLNEKHASAIALAGPRFPESIDIEDLYEKLYEIKKHLDSGKTLSLGAKIRHRSWFQFLEECSVDSGRVHTSDSVNALFGLAELTRARIELRSRWTRLVGPLGGPEAADNLDQTERSLIPHSRTISALLEWPTTHREPLAVSAKELGLDIASVATPGIDESNEFVEAMRTVQIVRDILPINVNRASRNLLKIELEQSLLEVDSGLANFDSGARRGDVIPELRSAIERRDTNSYQNAFQKLVELSGLARSADDRSKYLGILETVAPDWAESIRRREGDHAEDVPPGDPIQAWRWALLNDVLNESSSVSLDKLMLDLKTLEDSLQVVTGKLVSELAWASQLENTSLSQRQSLTGWVQAMRRIGRGTGKRARGLMDAARRLMSESRSAVPVWIMPISRAVESFDFTEPQFDVVIIDEASQSDIMAMTVLFLAKQVVIVGDDQQVSPTSIGQRVDQEKSLIEQYLNDIPNRELYDGRASIYDFAQQAFGGLVQLREHFRCVPEIISFSNALSYNGNIVPLREAVGVTRRPHVIEYKVDGVRKRDTNQEEAEFIVSAILSACELDEYSNATFGVISMLRDRQGRLIDDMLRNLMDPEEFARRRILVGSPPQFQGDERDVIFLSLVNSSEGGPQRLERSDDYKKRLNVAASRARDQMWVVHSLNPSTDLKPDDFRLRLIQHARNPRSNEIKSAAIRQKTRSEFENRVGDDLIRRGYKIEADYSVGAYFLDFVVFGADNSRIAIECDGDEFHTEENLNEDMARQALLERMDWRFIRLRGTEYFRDPETVMERVFRRLQDHGIEPILIDESEDETQTSEVKERLLAGAAKIRTEWAENLADQAQYEAEVTSTNDSPALPSAENSSESRLDDDVPSVLLSADEFSNHSSALPIDSLDNPAGTNTATITNNPPTASILPYQDATSEAALIAAANHPSEESPETLFGMIEKIVQIEWPVHHDVIMDRVRTAYGLGKLRGRTRIEVSGHLGTMLKDRRLSVSNDFYSLHQQDGSNPKNVQARTVGDRRVLHISDAELLAILNVTMQKSSSGSLTVDSAIDRLKSALEIRRLTSEVGERLTAIARKHLNSTNQMEDTQEASDNRVADVRQLVSISENALIRLGYNPSDEAVPRLQFLELTAIPQLTKEGTINSLNAIIRPLSNDPTIADNVKINLLADWKWLTD